MKICGKCNLEKPLEDFCNKKSEKDGKHRYCKSCMKIQGYKHYHEVRKIEKANYYKKYREKNKEYFNNYSHNHYHSNKELYREWEKNRLANDKEFRLKKNIGARINGALNTYNTLKKDRTIEYLGCNMEEYTLYLESKFTNQMNWDNYGIEWEIDHIKPICKFDLSTESQLYECFHYKNTQPLSKQENREKSGNYEQ